MVKKWQITVPTYAGEEIRNAYIYLPESYDWQEERYPVLYMFDGHNVFFDWDATYGKSWGMKEYMDFSGTQLIVAAVECSHNPDNGRLSEYSPFDFKDKNFGSVRGRGKETMEWMLQEFKPMIDREYRTIPDRDHTFIAGSSMGGLMSLYAVLTYSDYFSRAAALSPSIWVAPRKLVRMASEAELWPETVIYMDYGSEEMAGRKDMASFFSRLTARLMERGAFVTSRIVPGGTHCEACWEMQLPYVLSTLMYGYE